MTYYFYLLVFVTAGAQTMDIANLRAFASVAGWGHSPPPPSSCT
jgi:hypothetical protein